jgi:hypothetical protein
MNTLWKQALIAAALGTAVTASAQYTSPAASSPGATPDPSPMNKSATGTTPSTEQNRIPANRDQDAMKACANMPAAERDACIAREKAQHMGSKSPMSSGSSMTPGSSGGGGQSPGNSSGNNSGGGQSSGTSSGTSSGGGNGTSNGTGGASGGASGGATK